MSEKNGPNKTGPETATLRGDNGVLISAQNGDVIRYDDSGLVLRLADSVIKDISERLGDVPGAKAAQARPTNDRPQSTLQDAEILGDIDAWHLMADGDWLLFQANLAGSPGPRGYRRPAQGGDIIADAPGAVQAVLSIGGPRRAVGFDGIGDFPYHVVAPGDDIGAAGLAGSAVAQISSGFSQLREQTRDALTAAAILRVRQTANRALPLIMVRCEADQSASAANLASGIAFDNFMVAAKTLAKVAKTMGKKPRILAIGLEYCLEDVTSTGLGYRDGIYALMGKIELALGGLGYSKPRFVSQFECGDPISDAGCHTQAQWELAINPAGYDLIYSAPGYMFAQTAHLRPTPEALCQMAEMDAQAIEACLQVPRNKEEAEAGIGQWFCPGFLLAEREPAASGKIIRVTANAMSGLVIDKTADFGTSKLAGFSLENVENGAKLLGVRLCPEQPNDLLLRCDIAPEGKGIRLHYACGQTAKAAAKGRKTQSGFSHNRGNIRDSWQAESATGRRLHRWALPCILPVH